VDSEACVPLFRKLNEAGLPVICINLLPATAAHQYILAWTGPDDWGQFRMLARAFADKMGKTGGYAVVRHMPGSSPYFARTFAPITELREYAPEMKMLDMDSSELKTERTMALVSAWLKKYGPELKGIVLPDDGFCLTGTLEAMKNANRTDIVIVAAGNSKIGMDGVKAGEALAVTYQSAQGDGAIAVHTAAEWFSGKPIEPVGYLPKHVITQADVENYMPAQW
jgi:ABC-type sugar transport system substrate-binding protein